jgi:hypothetical protein
MATKDYNNLTTCFYVVEDGPDDLARPLQVTLDIAPTTAAWIREQTFADYLRKVHQTVQKGEFVPDYYIVRYEIEHPERLPDIRAVNEIRQGTFCDRIRDAGGIVTHIIPLRALEYIFKNKEEAYLESYIATGIIEQLLSDPQTLDYSKQYINSTPVEKALQAIETRKGTLFFDFSG